MANWEEDPIEARNRDEKKREKADKILTQYFQDREGRPVTQELAYNQLVSLSADKDHTCHWAFYEWIDKQVREGKLEKQPITKTEVIGYKLIYKGE